MWLGAPLSTRSGAAPWGRTSRADCCGGLHPYRSGISTRHHECERLFRISDTLARTACRQARPACGGPAAADPRSGGSRPLPRQLPGCGVGRQRQDGRGNPGRDDHRPVRRRRAPAAAGAGVGAFLVPITSGGALGPLLSPAGANARSSTARRPRTGTGSEGACAMIGRYLYILAALAAIAIPASGLRGQVIRGHTEHTVCSTPFRPVSGLTFHGGYAWAVPTTHSHFKWDSRITAHCPIRQSVMTGGPRGTIPGRPWSAPTRSTSTPTAPLHS